MTPTPARRTSPLVKLLAVVLIPGCVAGIVIQHQTTSERESAENARRASLTPEQRAAEVAAKAKAEADFQRGVAVARALKSGMKNPASFDLVSATLTGAGVLCLRYSGTNSFGATVPGYAVAPRTGALVAGSQDAVAGAWNKHCATQPGIDLRHIRQAL